MRIEQQRQDGIVIMDLIGRLDEMVRSEVEETFTRVLDEGCEMAVLDLHGVEYISSGGLRGLLMLSKAMAKKNGHLRLCRLSPFVAEVFEVSNFHRLFQIHPTREEAIASF